MASGNPDVERNRDFLVGEEVSPAGKERIRAFIAGWPGVVAVRNLIAFFSGPGEILVVARVDIDDALDGAAVEHLVTDIERDVLPYNARYVYVASSLASQAGSKSAERTTPHARRLRRMGHLEAETVPVSVEPRPL